MQPHHPLRHRPQRQRLAETTRKIRTQSSLDAFVAMANAKPVLGVCAGMQAIGVAHGLSLKRYVEIGMTPVTTLQQNPLFSGSFSAYSLHNFCVEPTAEFEVLAESSQCMQAMKHLQKEVYGMLFHPEVRNAAMVERFLQL